jgi:hypothetical protein
LNRSQWSAALPTEPGFYWMRAAEEFEPEIVRIRGTPSQLFVELFGIDGATALDGINGHEWFGPLAPPAA